MSDQLHQVCDICRAINTENDMAWVRIFGATLGNSSQPIGAFRGQVTPSQPRSRLTIDFCPACASKTTVDKIPPMCLIKPPAAPPGAVAA